MTDINKTFATANELGDIAEYLDTIAADEKIGVDHEEIKALADKAHAALVDLVSALVY